MDALLPLLALGLVLGMRHATDADHVVAVTTILSRQRRIAPAIRIGALWGVGHTMTILLVGGAIILLKVVIPPRLGLAMEFAVALMLIGLGAWNLSGRRIADSGPAAAARPVLVGIVHGLAGSAAIALLVLATITSTRLMVAYLLTFGAGTVAGMMLITAALATPLTLATRRFNRLERVLQLASGGLSLALGLFLAFQIGIVDGLFTAAPSWSPH